MNDLSAPKVIPFPPRTREFKSWGHIAGVFAEHAKLARADAWRSLAQGDGIGFREQMKRAHALTEAAADALAEEFGQ